MGKLEHIVYWGIGAAFGSLGGILTDSVIRSQNYDNPKRVILDVLAGFTVAGAATAFMYFNRGAEQKALRYEIIRKYGSSPNSIICTKIDTKTGEIVKTWTDEYS